MKVYVISSIVCWRFSTQDDGPTKTTFVLGKKAAAEAAAVAAEAAVAADTASTLSEGLEADEGGE